MPLRQAAEQPLTTEPPGPGGQNPPKLWIGSLYLCPETQEPLQLALFGALVRQGGHQQLLLGGGVVIDGVDRTVDAEGSLKDVP